MKLLILSDLHNEYEVMPSIGKDGGVDAQADHADVVVLAGDIHEATSAISWAREAFPNKPIVQVAGNHEYWGWTPEEALDLMREQARRLDVYFLENESVTIDGVRFLGCTLWTDYKLRGESLQKCVMADAYSCIEDFHLILNPESESGCVNPDQILARHEQSAAWLERELNGSDVRTVVVTHHAPVVESLKEIRHESRSAGAYASKLDHLMGYAPLWVHGHIHHSVDVEVSGTRVLSNPAGGFEDGRALNRFFVPLVVDL